MYPKDEDGFEDYDYDYVAGDADMAKVVVKSEEEIDRKYPKYRGLKGEPLPPPAQRISDWINDNDEL